MREMLSTNHRFSDFAVLVQKNSDSGGNELTGIPASGGGDHRDIRVLSSGNC
jgi:hypothetical protein